MNKRISKLLLDKINPDLMNSYMEMFGGVENNIDDPEKETSKPSKVIKTAPIKSALGEAYNNTDETNKRVGWENIRPEDLEKSNESYGKTKFNVFKEMTNQNGEYDPQTNTINLNLGNENPDVAGTVAHELSHAFREKVPYNTSKIKDFVLSVMPEDAKDNYIKENPGNYPLFNEMTKEEQSNIINQGYTKNKYDELFGGKSKAGIYFDYITHPEELSSDFAKYRLARSNNAKDFYNIWDESQIDKYLTDERGKILIKIFGKKTLANMMNKMVSNDNKKEIPNFAGMPFFPST